MKCRLTVLFLLAPTVALPAQERTADAEQVAAMEKIADLALVPPKLNTSPLPEYDYDWLDYGMTIGIERTPGGRDRNRSTDGEILLARFTEDDILGGTLVTPKSKLRMLISRPLAIKRQK